MVLVLVFVIVTGYHFLPRYEKSSRIRSEDVTSKIWLNWIPSLGRSKITKLLVWKKEKQKKYIYIFFFFLKNDYKDEKKKKKKEMIRIRQVFKAEGGDGIEIWEMGKWGENRVELESIWGGLLRFCPKIFHRETNNHK